MKPEGSLPRSQEPTTGLIPRHMNLVHHLRPYFCKINKILPICAYVFLVVSSFQAFPPKFGITLSFYPCVLRVPPILFLI